MIQRLWRLMAHVLDNPRAIWKKVPRWIMKNAWYHMKFRASSSVTHSTHAFLLIQSSSWYQVEVDKILKSTISRLTLPTLTLLFRLSTQKFFRHLNASATDNICSEISNLKGNYHLRELTLSAVVYRTRWTSSVRVKTRSFGVQSLGED